MALKPQKNGNTDQKKKRRALGPEARTWLITIVCIVVIGIVALPLLIRNNGGVNSVYVLAQLERPADTTPDPASFSIEIEDGTNTPAPTTASESPVPSEGVYISQYLQLQLDDDYPSVQQLQSRLMELGYLDSDEPNTAYGPATAAAVSLFQRTLNYDMNGIADTELQENLFSDRAQPYEIKLGDSGADVESMQSRLHELGYYDGKINGYFGVATEEALAAFQTKNEIDVDAVFNVSDRDLLYSPDARPKIDPTPTPAPTPKATKRPSSSSTKTSAPSEPSGGSSGSSGSSGDSGSSGSSGSSGDSGSSGSSGGDTSTPSFSASYSPDGLVSVSTAMVGKPYVYSEESPSAGFDCSGLVYYSLRTCGVSTGRYNAAGFSNVSSWGYVGSTGELVKGDLVFFNSPSSANVNHAGIYIGGGKFVHASSSKGQVLISSIGTNYWTTYFVNGRRVF